MPEERVADRLAAAAAAALVGRQVEQATLRSWVDDPAGPSAVFVHGPGGIGKSTLVGGTLRASAALFVDGSDIEPTPARFQSHLGQELGLGAGAPSLDDIATAVRDSGVTTFVIDSYERLAVLDGWLRNELLPSLPAATTSVLVGRNAPNAAWRTSPGWRHLLVDLHLGPLTDSDARELVRRRGLDGDRAERARLFGRGHPLALDLASEALLRHPELIVADGPPPAVIEDLVEVLFDDLDAQTREVVEAASLLRRATVPLLAAVLDRDEADIEPVWRTLRDLPFTTVQVDGVELQAVVQDAAASRLELRAPARAREIRRRAARAALSTLEGAPGWAATADLLHLVQNPVVRNAFLPPAGAQHPVESATEDDLAAVRAIATRHVGAGEAAAIERWWHHHPSALVVSRGADGGVRAFSVVAEAASISSVLVADDPVAAAAADDLRVRALPSRARALVHRQVLTAAGGRRPSPDLAVMIVDLKRAYLEMRPDLRRVYSVAEDQPTPTRTMHALGFHPICPVDLGGSPYQLWALEMPEGSVDAWIGAHVELENDGPVAVAAAGGEIADALAALSAREREVLTALADGLTNHQLADRLFISERTANRHISNIFTKLGVHNRTAAARIAIEAGLAG